MATAPIKLTAVFEPVEDGWVQASLVEWPAVTTCGRTREEAHETASSAHLRGHGCRVVREGGRHTIWENPTDYASGGGIGPE
jgi:hypothetical protein